MNKEIQKKNLATVNHPESMYLAKLGTSAISRPSCRSSTLFSPSASGCPHKWPRRSRESFKTFGITWRRLFWPCSLVHGQTKDVPHPKFCFCLPRWWMFLAWPGTGNISGWLSCFNNGLGSELRIILSEISKREKISVSKDFFSDGFIGQLT